MSEESGVGKTRPSHNFHIVRNEKNITTKPPTTKNMMHSDHNKARPSPLEGISEGPEIHRDDEKQNAERLFVNPSAEGSNEKAPDKAAIKKNAPPKEEEETRPSLKQSSMDRSASKRRLKGDQSVASHGSLIKKPRSTIGSIFRISQVEYDQASIRVRRPSLLLVPKVSFANEDPEATWNDVYHACCYHTFQEWINISGFLCLLLVLLYFFLVGLDLVGTAFQVVGGCTAGSLLGSDTNPLAAVMVGIIATVLLQSSSTTTAVIVSLVSGGLDVQQGIYMVMGANVGTAVTSMLVSLAHMGDGEELERAFAGSSVLYVFNFLTVVILLPLEIGTKYLYKFTKLMLPASVGSGNSWEGPIKKIVSPLVKKIIIANKGLIDDISTGAVESCSNAYPVHCTNGIESYETCNVTGVIACNKDTGACPAFFQNGASKQDDMVSGWVCMVFAMSILVICLVCLVALLRKMLLGASTKIIYKATNINPYLAMLIGCGITILVQSSSVTTSTLVPLAGIGVLNLESMYPLVLGADIGTTFTALMAAMVSSKVESLQIALVHFFFNVTGIIIWYPIPFMRRFVLGISALLGKATGAWKGFPAFFIVVMFLVLPLLLLGISACFEKQSSGFTALGIFMLLIIFVGISYFFIWWHYLDGKTKFQDKIRKRQRRAAAIQALADDMDYLKVDTEWCRNEIGRIKDYASHLQTSTRMEEGRAILQGTPGPSPEERDEEDMGGIVTEDDERLSTYESCRSKPWRDVLYMSAGSIRSGPQVFTSNFLDAIN
jgi:sodium-dependent phosphate cotransporter